MRYFGSFFSKTLFDLVYIWKFYHTHAESTQKLFFHTESSMNRFNTDKKISRLLSQFASFFMGIRPNAQQSGTNFIAVSVNEETISSLTESTWKRNDFIANCNGEIFQNLYLWYLLRALTASSQLAWAEVRHLWAPYCVHPPILNS